MKKIKYIIFVMLAIFIYSNEVSAEDAKCVYNMGSGYLECSLTDGKTPTCKLNAKYPAEHLGTVNLSNVDFQDVSNNQWLCPKKIYSNRIYLDRDITYSNVSTNPGETPSRLSHTLSESNSSYGNKISDESENVSYCKYGNLILTINHTQKTITSSAAMCSLTFTYDELETTDCPSRLYQLQASVGTQMVCNYSLNSKPSYNKIELNADEPIEDAAGNKVEIDQKPDKVVTNGETIKLIKQIYNIIKILIPVLIIALSIVDFLKVILTSDDKNYKSAWDKFVKRLIIGVIFFLIPIIVSFILKYSGIETEQSYLEIFK